MMGWSRGSGAAQSRHEGANLALPRPEMLPARAAMIMPGATSYRRMRRMLRVGVLLSTVPFLLLVAVLTLIPIPGATIATGYLTSESSAKDIQSPQTAVVKAILVKDGDAVRAGDRLVELDDTSANA